MELLLRRYTRIALFNILLIAGIGVVLRYKIAFYLPFINQKHLLHGHSHFAFAGWVTHALLFLLVRYMAAVKGEATWKKYKWIIIANLVTAYGMLISFPIQGYGLFSIIFSTLNIFVSYAFAFYYWKDLNRIAVKNVGHWWLKLSLLFNVVSSFGAFSLAFMMATKSMHQDWYLASVYFFLHFQYNGWFFFACMGLATLKFFIHVPAKTLKQIFWLFALACIPAYVLSALWLPLPKWTYTIVVLAACMQVAGWALLLKQIKKQSVFIQTLAAPNTIWVLALSCIALSIKLLLQLGSTIPSLSKLAFGFRPIVIGYLHLILLGVISIFLVGYMLTENIITTNNQTKRGIKIFIAGVIINELLLMIQGIAAMTFTPTPFINESLLAAAIIIFIGLIFLNLSQKKSANCVES